MSEDIPDTGAVFTFGKSRFADNEPSHFFIKNDPIVAISCGDEHSAVICQNGRVFVFGGNSWGQLGLGHKDEVSRPSCVKWLKPQRALFVACGRAHTVFVTDGHAVYTAGCNEEGQLGTGDTAPHTVPQYVEVADDVQIRQVSAGSNHTAILTVTGRVYVCGSNSEGQLGLGEDTRSALKFTELNFMEKIAFVECGYYHTVFITTKGVVFVTGDNEGQKLGIPNTESNIYVPIVLPIQTPIKDACCGANHTFLLSMDESKILAFGSNDAGQLGLPKDVGSVLEPTEIDMDKMFDGNQLKLVACGAMHTAFVTDNGLLYTCGEARHNKLCLDEIDDNTNDPANQYSPKQVTAMDGYVVDNVACGGCHTLLTATKTAADRQPEPTDETKQTIELPPLRLPMNTSRADDGMNGNEDNSIDSLEANVSGSHIVNINDLDNASTHDAPELKDEEPPSPIETSELMEIIDSMDTLAEKVDDGIKDIKDAANEKIEAVEETIKKSEAVTKHKCEEFIALNVPEKIVEIANSPPPKSPILKDLLHVPDLTQVTSEFDDGQKSDAGSKSENETIPCGSDKSSPLAKTKTQAVMPIVRSEDIMDSSEMVADEEGVVVNKMDEKGRFARMFQSIRDKENSCMGKGKVIEETVEETVHKGITATEETVHKIEETVTTEIRNQTNSRTCNIL